MFTENEKKRQRQLLSTVVVKPDSYYKKNIVPKIIQNKARYFEIAKQCNVPPIVIALIHAKEMASDLGKFKTYIGNGQLLNIKTTIVPKNRGPFSTWELGVIDAIVTIKELHKIAEWSIERLLYELERYNGFGYRPRNVFTPYVWNGTNHYIKGRFVSDGKYDPNSVSQALGAYALYTFIVEQDLSFAIDYKQNGEIITMPTQPEESFLAKLLQVIIDFFKSTPKTEAPAPVETNDPDVIHHIPLLGDKGDVVRFVQTRLNKNGASLLVDGSFGTKTQAAISEFQKKAGLAASGVLSPKTLEALNIKYMPPNTTGMRDKAWTVASGEIGVKEIVGSKHNPRILEYHKTTGGFGDDETAWCASFCNWVMRQIGASETRSAAARSFLTWGVKTTSPKQGDVVVFWRVSPTGWQGHVAFFHKMDATHVWVLGGNQSNSVNISKYERSTVLDFRTYS